MRSAVSSPWVGRLVVASLLALPLTARAQTAPARPRGGGANGTVSVKVTDSVGAPLAGIKVTASGPVARGGATDASGDVRFTAVRNGTYRLRFEGEKVITFEREVTVGAGQPSTIEVSLSPAPPRPCRRRLPKSKRRRLRASDAPPPEPKTVGIPEFVERNMLTQREPSKSTLVACGAASVTNLLQIRDPLKDQVHQGSDALLYVVGGDGLLLLGTQQIPLTAGTFSVVPRGMTHTLQRRGNRGLILLSTLTDTPCR